MKILIITDKYYPKPYANALCAQELIREFKCRGYNVDVIAFQDSGIELPAEYEGNKIYGVKPDMRLRLFYYADNYSGTVKGKISGIAANIMSKGKNLFLLPWQPFYTFSFPRRICRLIESLYKKEKYDAIVSVFGPFDGAYGAIQFKRKHPEVPLGIYAVDTLDKTGVKNILHGMFYHSEFWEKRFLQNSDVFIPMQSRMSRFEQSSFDQWQNKIFAADLPRLTFQKGTEEQERDYFKNGKENWVYAGSLNPVHYPVGDLLRYFLKLPNDKERVLHFYSRGNGLKDVEKAAEENPGRIVSHGYVNSNELSEIMKSCDVLVSVKYSNQISAKIFECISYGKPIVHFSGTQNDPDIEYLNKYPNAFIFKTYEKNAEHRFSQCLEMIENAKKGSIDEQQLKAIFVKNTPEYSVQLLIDHLGLQKT